MPTAGLIISCFLCYGRDARADRCSRRRARPIGGTESKAENARLGAKRCRPVGSFFGGSCETVGSNYPVEVCKEEERSERSVHFKARLLFGKPKECFASNPVGKTEAGFRNRVKKEMSRSVYVGIAGAAPDCLPRFVGQVSGPRV